jgi:hypothetical protein
MHKTIILAVVTILFSGCAQQETEPLDGFIHDWETATYRIIGSNQIEGTLDVKLTLKETLIAEIQVTLIETPVPGNENTVYPATAYNFTQTIDPQTGELLAIETPEASVYPIGPSKFAPEAGAALQQNLRVQTLATPLLRTFTLTGLQWATQLESNQWGEVSLKPTATNGWSVSADIPCQSSCAYNNGESSSGSLSMNGTAGALPSFMRLDYEKLGLYIEFTATKHALGEPVDIELKIPDKLAFERLENTCTDYKITCESESWPTELSLISGLEALQLNAEYLIFNQQDNNNIFQQVAAVPSNTGGTTWLFRFVSLEDRLEHVFFQTSTEVADVTIPTGVLLQQSTYARPDYRLHAAPAAGYLPLDKLYLAALEPGLGFENLEVVYFNNGNEALTPDWRQSASAVFQFNDGEWLHSKFVNAATGHLAWSLKTPA